MHLTHEFKDGLKPQKNNKKAETYLSLNALSFALFVLMKTNHLAREFCNELGYKILLEFLENECLTNAQIAYNIVGCLWILSYHDKSHIFFEDYGRAVIEKVSKILDYFSWEKLVRIMLMLFDNLKENAVCQEHLSDIDCLSLVIKLQNRHWVDEDINKLLEKLFEFLETNQKVFSSIDKLRNQVKRGQLRWGPCHTEKFWQENFILFDNSDGLQLIKDIVVICLGEGSNDRTKAVACFDLGEFARFFPNGKQVLDTYNVKQKMAQLMQSKNVTSEVKKEAITCYQKLLMNSWSSTDFKGSQL